MKVNRMGICMMKDFKSMEFQLYDFLVQLREIFKSCDIDEHEINKINNDIEFIQSRKFNVAVMGEFKRGKSSLINGILGIKVLPADATPTTATINRITYGNEPSLNIYYKDGTCEYADMGKISDYVTMLTEEGLKCASKIKEAVIKYPTVICQNDVDIIDTPGLNDNEIMSKTTMDMLKNVDAVIVAISALSPFSITEAQFAAQLIESENIESILFVVTYIDQIDEEDYDKVIGNIRKRINDNVIKIINSKANSKDLISKANRILNNAPIWGVSSYLALKSFVNGDTNLLKQSKFEIFKTELYESLTSKQGLNIIIKTAKNIRNYCVDFDDKCNSKITAIKNDISDIDMNYSYINDYLSIYIRTFNSCFNTHQESVLQIIKSLSELKNIIYKNITNSIKNSDSNQIELIIAREAAASWEMVNNNANNLIKEELNKIYSDIISEFLTFRNKNFKNPVEYFRNNGLTVSLLPNMDIEEIMSSFGYPVFNWIASPVLSSSDLINPNSLNIVKSAIDISVSKLYEHWMLYIEASRNWFLTQFINEAESITKSIDIFYKEYKERKENDVISFKAVYSVQKPKVLNIKDQADSIYENVNK